MKGPFSSRRSPPGSGAPEGTGRCFFHAPRECIAERRLPDGPWRWTDDTAMAVSIVEELVQGDSIDEDRLARRFAMRFAEEPGRGYGGGASRLLARYAEGGDWRRLAPQLFDGGSWGNGAAMRVAPVGAWFAGDPDRAADQGERSARVTHAHPEGRAGARAVAAAAALRAAAGASEGDELLRAVLPRVPGGETRDAIERALHLPDDDPERAASASDLGTGQRMAAFDTVPWCLWVVAHHGHAYEDALWITVGGGGDVDTTGAIVGGIVGAGAPVPPDWLERREPLPEPSP